MCFRTTGCVVKKEQIILPSIFYSLPSISCLLYSQFSNIGPYFFSSCHFIHLLFFPPIFLSTFVSILSNLIKFSLSFFHPPYILCLFFSSIHPSENLSEFLLSFYYPSSFLVHIISPSLSLFSVVSGCYWQLDLPIFHLIHFLSIHLSIPPSVTVHTSTDQVLLFFVPSLHSSNFLTFMTFPSYKATDKSSYTSFSSSSIHFSFLSLQSVCVRARACGPHALQQLQPIPLARWAGLQWRGKHNDNTSVSRTHSSLAATAPALTLRLVPPFIHHSWGCDFFSSLSVWAVHFEGWQENLSFYECLFRHD